MIIKVVFLPPRGSVQFQAAVTTFQVLSVLMNKVVNSCQWERMEKSQHQMDKIRFLNPIYVILYCSTYGIFEAMSYSYGEEFMDRVHGPGQVL
ncbi:hypothetical protein SADUNF_Sadunf10G0001600 [Salix dunnii]|uniref:Uncharacterized protein n=1 Tax=Salix dunnii TaxID=1413687 RepID=A0A835MQY2_9ROSI|nr:hypothetical protein SADUNF_Sadunf10G0001600 [Salix dunnii]